MRLLAIDLGYSAVKVAYYNESGALQLEKYTSAVAKIEDPMDIDNDVMFRVKADTYVLGDYALKLSRSLLMPLETFEDMKAVYPVWIAYLLKKFGGMDKFDHVIIGLSLAFSDRADELLSSLYEALLIEKPNYFICLPQGLSCKLAYSEHGLNISSTSKNTMKLKNYIVMDGGFLSIDICAVINQSSSAGAAIGVPNTGVICIAYDVADYLFREHQIKVSIKEAAHIVDSGGIVQRRGRKLDISQQLKQFIKKYLGNVLTLLEDKYSEYLDACDGLIVLGGLAYFFQKYWEDPEVISEIEKHFDRDFIHISTDGLSEFYNAFSYLRFTEDRLGK